MTTVEEVLRTYGDGIGVDDSPINSLTPCG